MRNTLLYFLAALVIFPIMAQQQPEWQSQYAVGLNKLAPHTYVWPYQTVSDIRNGDYESSPYYMSLNGSWKFHWVKNPDNRPKDFYKPEFYTGGWADIQVPGNRYRYYNSVRPVHIVQDDFSPLTSSSHMYVRS